MLDWFRGGLSEKERTLGERGQDLVRVAGAQSPIRPSDSRMLDTTLLGSIARRFIELTD
jgi:hypothetical protein